MEQSSKDISSFYDGFASHQKKTGTNIRHRTIFRNLKNAGLKKDSSVLEIGCGIGTVTSLIAKYALKAKIVAVDISPQSIEIAKQVQKHFPNIQFIVSDMTDFKSELKFDFVVLPDVLEHIPVEQHRNLFNVIRKHTHPDSTVLINIPNPPYLRWLRKNKPNVLQIIDQPISTDILLNDVYANDFHLHSLNVYSLSIKEGEYQCIILKRQKEYELKKVTPLSKTLASVLDIKSKI